VWGKLDPSRLISLNAFALSHGSDSMSFLGKGVSDTYLEREI